MNRAIKRAAVLLGLLGLGDATASRLRADMLTYTETEIASGSLGGTGFTNALVTVTFTGDTADITGSGFIFNPVGTATVSVAGIGTATFTDAMLAADGQGQHAAGIADDTQNGTVLATVNAEFATYDLTTAIGPITDTSFIRPDLTFGTTLGGFNIRSDSGISTFTASSVPEPGSVILLGIGGVGLAAFRARRVASKRRAA